MIRHIIQTHRSRGMSWCISQLSATIRHHSLFGHHVPRSGLGVVVKEAQCEPPGPCTRSRPVRSQEVVITTDDPLPDAPDATLAARARDGDVHAFEIIARRHGPLMRVYAAKLLGSEIESDDIVQESFLTGWRHITELENPGQVRNWLMRIVTRRAIDRIRVRREHENIDDWNRQQPGGLADRVVEARLQLDAVWEALDKLPADQRRCWLLRETAGYSYQEIADGLDLPVSTVRGLARARRFLLTKWRHGDDPHDDAMPSRRARADRRRSTAIPVDRLVDYLDAGRTPATRPSRGPPPAGCTCSRWPGCASCPAPPSRTGPPGSPTATAPGSTGLLDSIRREVVGGREIPVTHPDPAVRLSVTEAAARGLVRRAGDTQPGVVLGSTAFEGDLTTAGADVVVRVTAAARYGLDLGAVADELRTRITEALTRHTGLTVTRVDVLVDDVFVAREDDR